jgi:hypothetical protein
MEREKRLQEATGGERGKIDAERGAISAGINSTRRSRLANVDACKKP